MRYTPPLPATPVRRRGPNVKYTKRKLALDPPAPKGHKKGNCPPGWWLLTRKPNKNSCQAPLQISGEREETKTKRKGPKVLSIQKENRPLLRKVLPKRRNLLKGRRNLLRKRERNSPLK